MWRSSSNGQKMHHGCFTDDAGRTRTITGAFKTDMARADGADADADGGGISEASERGSEPVSEIWSVSKS